MKLSHAAPLALLAAATVAVVALGLGDGEAPAPTSSAAADRAAPPPAAAPTAPETPALPGAQGVEATYRLTYAFTTTVEDSAGPEGRVSGTWRTRTLADGRIAVWLEEATIEGHESLPAADAVAGPVEIAGAPGGRLEGMGFPPRMAPAARRLYTTLASAFWYTERPSDSWQVDEQDLTGTYMADYRTLADGERVRTVLRYTALRSGQRLLPPRPDTVRPDGSTRFVLDDDGLVEAGVDTRLIIELGEGLPRVESTIEARVERVAVKRVPLMPSAAAIRPLQDHVDLKAQAAQIDAQQVAGADLDTLLDITRRAAALDREDGESQKHRSVALRRLAALARLQPGIARDIAAEVAGADPSTAGLLLGALGSAGTAEATDAIAGLLDTELDPPLDPQLRAAAMAHLGLVDVGTPGALAAAEAAAREGDPMGIAAMGSQAGKLADSHPEAAGAAVDRLMQALAAADGPDRLAALGALGNSGAESALPMVAGLMSDADPRVAEAAVFALRFMPAGEADRLLEEALQGGGRGAMAAARAAAFRDAGHWRPLLRAQAQTYGDDPRLAAAIDHTLAQLR